jgi:hypothetical protein
MDIFAPLKYSFVNKKRGGSASLTDPPRSFYAL